MGATDVFVSAPAAAPAITWCMCKKQETVRCSTQEGCVFARPPVRCNCTTRAQGGAPATAASAGAHMLHVSTHNHTHLAQHLAAHLLWGQLLSCRGRPVLQRHGYARRRRGAGSRHGRGRVAVAARHRASRFSGACIAPTLVLGLKEQQVSAAPPCLCWRAGSVAAAHAGWRRRTVPAGSRRLQLAAPPQEDFLTPR